MQGQLLRLSMVLQAAHNADEVKVEILGEYVVQKRTLEEAIGILDLINKETNGTHGNNRYHGKGWYASYENFEVGCWPLNF